MIEPIIVRTEVERVLFEENSRLMRENHLLNEENEYIRRTAKHELLSWIPVVVSHLHKNDTKFDSIMYNEALDDAVREICRWLR